ncbi:hypothetical protein EYF80_029886 [Liparis tanakae]|uniref:Uncharacterized protein n=1 Tax=Liparis tanakae TaxID=230148 RepID=A0A4Z2H376_9TELE|nr:hypothetical protein EYF80_029886 [Liparis tanakae]
MKSRGGDSLFVVMCSRYINTTYSRHINIGDLTQCLISLRALGICRQLNVTGSLQRGHQGTEGLTELHGMHHEHCIIVSEHVG